MLPKYLKIKGFRSYIDTEIDFTQFGDMFCVIGQNGAGKSSIIEMITTALYWVNSCTDSKGAGMDECINSDCDHFELEFCFVMNNIEYIIKTTKYRGESRELEFYIDGVNQSEKVTETQEKINNVLKMDYDTFLDTVCIGQGKSSRFMSKKPAERKQTLMQILDVQKYEQYEKLAKEKKKAIKEQMDAVLYKIELLNSEEIDVDSLNSEIAENEKLLKQTKHILENLEYDLEQELKNKAEYETMVKQNEEIKKNFASAQNHMENMKRKVLAGKEKAQSVSEMIFDESQLKADIQSKTDDLSKIKDKIDSIKEEISDKKSSLAVVDTRLTDVMTKLTRFEKYGESICELCGNEITDTHREKHLSEMRQEKDKYAKQKTVLVTEIDNLKETGKEISVQGRTLNEEIQTLKDRLQDNTTNKNNLALIKERIAEYKDMYTEAKTRYESLEKVSVVDIENKTFNDGSIKMEISTLREKSKNLSTKILEAQHKIESYEKNKTEVDNLNSQLAKLKEQHTDYGSVATAFGKSGIPASIIAHDIPEMESETNKILKVISNDTMSIQFITSKQTAKGKKTTDTLEIVVNDTNGARAYETYSGGEKFRIDFACHIGMAKFLTKRAGASIDFLIIDEGLGSQDDFAKQKFIESINALKGLFKQIMVITHIQDLQNAFDKRVLVEKDQLNGSKVEIIS
jgi:exonuclease SbcC